MLAVAASSQWVVAAEFCYKGVSARMMRPWKIIHNLLRYLGFNPFCPELLVPLELSPCIRSCPLIALCRWDEGRGRMWLEEANNGSSGLHAQRYISAILTRSQIGADKLT